MDVTDASAAECLRILLEDQAQRLTRLASRILDTTASGFRIAPEEWTGPARNAHDECVRRFAAQLELVHASVERAAVESSRAAATLAGRV